MKLAILKKENQNLLEFVSFWSNLYNYPRMEDLYKDRINKETFDESDIKQFYIWKNGMKLSKQKQKSVDSKIINRLDIINEFKLQSDFDVQVFGQEFKDLSAVWKIFLLHIIKPNKYPIYDQHIHRAYLFIHNQNYLAVDKLSDKKKERFYFEEYLKFINKQKNDNDINLKKLDEALFTFGRFLNTEKYMNIFNS